jgi:hypothetical protein
MAVSLRGTIDDARATALPTTDRLPAPRVVAALARIEGLRLLRHPSYLLSIAFALLLFRAAIGAGSDTGLLRNVAWLVGGIALGSMIGSVLSANVAALRTRRDHLQELFGSLPAPPEARTAGILLGLAVGPGALAVALSGLSWIVFERIEDLAEGADLFMAAQYPLSVLALGAIGVAVARWIPSVLGGPMVVIAHVFTGMVWAVPWIAMTNSGISVPWHLAYLVAVIVAFSALAFARDRRTVARFILAAGALGTAVVAALQQVPPGGF